MSKDEFVSQLIGSGYKAELDGVLPTVYTNNMNDKKAVCRLAKSCGYEYSFAVKLVNQTT